MDPDILKHFNLSEPSKITQLAGGANNRVFKFEYVNERPLVFKQYFQHPNDLRQRLESEFAFLEYAWQLGLRNIPEPIKASSSLNGAIYSYLPGKLVQETEITTNLIEQKIDFLLALNQNKSRAHHLPKASEACFSIQNFLDITESRIKRLKGRQQEETSLEKDLKTYLKTSLLPKWDLLKTKTCKAALHSPLDVEISTEERIVTPSDYGFHNALIENERLSFFDFEYAGWDDPCKTVSDLFCQPRIPIPEKYFLPVATKLSSLSKDPDVFLTRLNIVLPIIQMKWCCILLNIFTHVGKSRRMFSQSEELDQMEKQLNLSKEQLSKIQI